MGRKHRRKKAAPAPAPEPAVVTSSQWRLFLWLCGFFFLVALVTGLSFFTAWPGAEGHALAYEALRSFGREPGDALEKAFLFPRLFSAFCLVSTFVITWFFGSRLFGEQATQLGLLCAGASLYLPFYGKVATLDAVMLLGQAGLVFSGLLYLVGKNKNYLLPGLFFLGITLCTLAAQFIWPELFYVRLGADAGAMVVGSTVGMLPLAGWLLGGLRDLVYRMRKQDQLAKIQLLGLGVGAVTGSLLFPLFLALIAGKQMQLYFREGNYPWKDWVRSGSVLHLVGAFIVVVLVLAGGGLAFPGAGFTAALGMAAAYWIFSLLGVVGNFGDRRNFALGGALFAGYLSAMFFWVQVYPYLEYERSWPERLVKLIPAGSSVGIQADDVTTSAIPYLREAGVTVLTTPEAATDFQLVALPAADTVRVLEAEVTGRVVLGTRRFGLESARVGN